MSGKSEFYQSHLDRVSRSFAFCIRQLPDPLRIWVGLSYLLCRIVDTIEDASWSNADEQLETFSLFDAALAGRAQALEGWEKKFPASIPKAERELLTVASVLMRDLEELASPINQVIRELVLSMSQGMQHFCRERSDRDLRLSTLEEVNQYCFFVAGLVGELLAKLMAAVEPRFRLSVGHLLCAHHFGLFLQKVNLLKDQVEDEKSGRHLIPSRQIVEDSSQENAEQALEFIATVPHKQIEFRRFCAWSLFLGLESLVVARESVKKSRVMKVSRARTQSILAEVEGLLDNDQGLRSLFETFVQKLGWSPWRRAHSKPAKDFPGWLLPLYRGPLDCQNLTTLGLA